jgi:hypothetical protein
MAAVEPAREKVARRLQDAVDRLRRDMDEVEFWTEVLGCLTQPAPDYESTNVLNRFALPQQSSEGAGEPGEIDPRHRVEKSKNRQPGPPSNRRQSGH